MTGTRTNWAGNVVFGAGRFHVPSTVEQLQELVATSEKIRALGTGHSFSRIADTTGDLVSTSGLPPGIEIDPARSLVEVAGAVRYGELAQHLDREGYALHNLGSLPHISVAGGCATATHGSGQANGNLATAIAAVELVRPNGELETVDRESAGDELGATAVGLGALGVVTRLRLDIQPSFEIRQYVYEGLGLDDAVRNLDEILSCAYSVSLFTTWREPHFDQVWVKQRLDRPGAWRAEPLFMGARLADGPRHPIPGASAEHCTEQMGSPGPWFERLPHFKLGHVPSSGEELQSEYLVAREHAVDALHALSAVREHIAPVLQICEVRTVCADALWLSPSYRRDTVGLHFTWLKDSAAVLPVLGTVEKRLEPFAARPHWGKLFTTTPEVVRSVYERSPDFEQLARGVDPTGKFRNEMIDRYLSIA